MTVRLPSSLPVSARVQRGGTFLGIVIGLVLGLAISLAVAVYVTKVPVPFVNKGQTRTAEQDAAEAKKNKDWDPNAPLSGKSATRASGDAAGAEGKTGADAPAGDGKADTKTDARPDAKADAKADTKADTKPEAKPEPKPEAKAESKPAVPADPFQYFLQVGAFRGAEEAEAQRAKLSLQGLQTKVSERDQGGRVVYRVRMGPFERRDEADRQKEKLDALGIESALVRVQR